MLNGTGFAVSTPGAERQATPFDRVPGPVLQVVFSGGTEAAWAEGTHGLSARDIAMNVALPEVDGRVLSRAASFKSEAHYDPATQCAVVAYQPVADRIAFIAELARGWLELARTPAAERRLAVVLANYPNKDGRLGNGVGLDTPAGTLEVLRALKRSGYDVGDLPECGQALIARLAEGPTNDLTDRHLRPGGERYGLADYRTFFAGLPEAVRRQVADRWGAPEDDPFVVDGAFLLSAYRLGHVVIGLQPARGYNIDPVQTYHDPALVPPHGYLAFYAWLRQTVGIQAVVHMGKHGNMEWLPGKALCLSEACFPEAAFGPLPHLYPFIVNDPGEGTQAKRRAQAVIIDHLTPPLDPGRNLWAAGATSSMLVDEYYQAAGVDPRRHGKVLLRRHPRALSPAISASTQDCGIAGDGRRRAPRSANSTIICASSKSCRSATACIFSARAPEPADQLYRSAGGADSGCRGPAAKAGDASLIRALAARISGSAGRRSTRFDCPLPRTPWTGPRPVAAWPPCRTIPWRSCRAIPLNGSNCLARQHLSAGGRSTGRGLARAAARCLTELPRTRVRPAVLEQRRPG